MIIDFPAIAMDGAGGRTFVGAMALTLLSAAADLPGSGAFWRPEIGRASCRERVCLYV